MNSEEREAVKAARDQLEALLVAGHEPMKSGWHGPGYDFNLYRPWPDEEDPDDTWMWLQMQNIPRRVRDNLYGVIHSAVSAVVENYSAGRKFGFAEGEKKAEEA